VAEGVAAVATLVQAPVAHLQTLLFGWVDVALDHRLVSTLGEHLLHVHGAGSARIFCVAWKCDRVFAGRQFFGDRNGAVSTRLVALFLTFVAQIHTQLVALEQTLHVFVILALSVTEGLAFVAARL